MEKKNKYINFIVDNGINLQPEQPVVISASVFVKDFVLELKQACLRKGASFVYIDFYDSEEEIDKIYEGYSKYIDEKVEFYQRLMNEGFCRISIDSPFVPVPSFPTDKLNEYRLEQKKLLFLLKYFYWFNAQHTICVVPNPYWAQKLQMSLDALWSEVYEMTFSDNNAEEFRYYLNKLNVKELIFNDGVATNLRVKLTNNFLFMGPTVETKDKIVFQPNIPSREVYTAPLKEGVNGKVYTNKNKNDYNYFGYYNIVFKDGKVIEQENLDEIIDREEMKYCGEISLVEYSNEAFYRDTLLDENMGCHLALGGAYPFGLTEFNKTNHSNRHVDIIFGTSTMDVKAICDKGEIYIMRKGKFVYEDQD